jgi:hypothetical protein
MNDHTEHGSARWATVRHVVESVAIVAAGLWAAYVFIYQERIKPTFESPSLQVTVTLDPGKTVNGTRIAQLHLNFVNTGQVDTDIYADSASIYGDRYAAAAPVPSPSYGANDVEVNRMVQTGKKELVYSYAILRPAAIGGTGDHIALTPGQHFDNVLPIAVKDGRFDELHADVMIIYGRFTPDRRNFSRVSIQRLANGAVYLKMPKKRIDSDGFEDGPSVQTTL